MATKNINLPLIKSSGTSPNKISKQRHRINQVVNYIRNELIAEIDLDEMADIAKCSKFYFSRLFTAYLHESPHQYLMRFRLEKAANQLIKVPTSNITQIAMAYGFSGSDTFARSFKQRYSLSPRAFRNLNQMAQGEIKLSTHLQTAILKPGKNIFVEGWDIRDVDIQVRPEYRVAYIRYIGPYGDIGSGISDTYTKLIRWAKTRGLLHAKSEFLGRILDNCSITAGRQCTYDACIVLDDEIAEDDVVSIQTIPGGRYAVFNTRCEPSQRNRVWDWLYEKWLPESGRLLKPIPHYEFSEYDNKDCHPDDIQLCLPLL
jgi:AraC family transcriptional regulator